jgi:hypothetical protein
VLHLTGAFRRKTPDGGFRHLLYSPAFRYDIRIISIVSKTEFGLTSVTCDGKGLSLQDSAECCGTMHSLS